MQRLLDMRLEQIERSGNATAEYHGFGGEDINERRNRRAQALARPLPYLTRDRIAVPRRPREDPWSYLAFVRRDEAPQHPATPAFEERFRLAFQSVGTNIGFEASACTAVASRPVH